MTKDEVIEAIQAQQEKFGQAKSTYDHHLHKQAIKFFGTWQEACEAAGVKAMQPKSRTRMRTKAVLQEKREPRRDCRFLAEDGCECEALNALYCAIEGKCVFFKPKRAKN